MKNILIQYFGHQRSCNKSCFSILLTLKIIPHLTLNFEELLLTCTLSWKITIPMFFVSVNSSRWEDYTFCWLILFSCYYFANCNPCLATWFQIFMSPQLRVIRKVNCIFLKFFQKSNIRTMVFVLSKWC